MTQDELDGLLRRWLDGDEAAFEPLFGELWPKVVRHVQHRLRSLESAEDVAASAMRSAINHARSDEFEDPSFSHFRRLVFKIVVNRTIDRMKNKVRQHTVLSSELDENPQADPKAPDSNTILGDIQDAVWSCISSLPSQHARWVAELRLKKVSQRQTAKELGVSVSFVRTSLESFYYCLKQKEKKLLGLD